MVKTPDKYLEFGQASIEVHPSNWRQAMTPNVKQERRVTAWLGVACLGLLPVSFLSAQEPKLRATLFGHTNAVVAVAFSPDSKTLASASHDGTLKLWDMTTGKERATLQGHTKEDKETSEAAYGVESVAFSLDGKTLAAAAHDMTVKVWDVATARRSTLQGHTHAVYCVAFSSDSKTLASASGDKTVKLWDLATGKERATLHGHTESVMSVAFCSDGKTLASASSDKTVKLWDVATGKELATLQGHEAMVYSVAFSPDGKTLASVSGDETVKLWDVDTGK
jgi:WD40 repeat protein